MFLWNFHHMQPLVGPLGDEAAKWLVPVVHGFFAQASFTLLEKTVRLTVMSRRSRHHAGTRYLKRGMDADGHVANEVETEQILHVHAAWAQGLGRISSLVLLRGSIPLFWSQENPMSPAPAVVCTLTLSCVPSL